MSLAAWPAHCDSCCLVGSWSLSARLPALCNSCLLWKQTNLLSYRGLENKSEVSECRNLWCMLPSLINCTSCIIVWKNLKIHSIQSCLSFLLYYFSQMLNMTCYISCIYRRKTTFTSLVIHHFSSYCNCCWYEPPICSATQMHTYTASPSGNIGFHFYLASSSGFLLQYISSCGVGRVISVEKLGLLMV